LITIDIPLEQGISQIYATRQKKEQRIERKKKRHVQQCEQGYVEEQW
jgi:hypothetical protein